MNNHFFSKLAATNLKKNSKSYIPYILACIVTVAMFYIVKSLSLNPGLEKMIGSDTLTYLMFLASIGVALFAVVFLFYTNSFLVKNRKKEFGVFNILGMEKSHLVKILGWENLYVAVISLTAGLILGIALDKAMFLLIVQVIGADIVLGFFVSSEAILTTLLLFAAIFFLVFVNSARQIQIASPVELLSAGKVGEKEPKTKWLIAVLGLFSTVAGYIIAVTVGTPKTAIGKFFVAALLVAVGTYLLFTAGSIALLKMLRKNKRYYYKANHFVSISSMVYRMKQNAVGLATICVLSTAVLIMLSSTSSLMIGMKDVINTRYPYDFVVYSYEQTEERAEASFLQIQELQKKLGLNVTQEMQYSYLPVMLQNENDAFFAPSDVETDNLVNLIIVSLTEYNALTGTDIELQNNEALLFLNHGPFNYSTLHVFDSEYQVKEKLSDFLGSGIFASDIANSYFLVVQDTEMQKLYEEQKEILRDFSVERCYFYGFDMDASQEDQQAFIDAVFDIYTKNEYSGTMESRLEARDNYIALYGGFFFIGIFLGVLFVMATVLIMYYKQISEGYDDKQRFEIMRKVGLSQQEIKKAIHSQTLTVFFLPLVMAEIHTVFALPMMIKLLALFNLYNESLYLNCTVVCYVIFAVIYMVTYSLTAKTYYKIVRK